MKVAMAVGLLLLLLLFYHRRHQVRGHSVGSSHPGVEAYLRMCGGRQGWSLPASCSSLNRGTSSFIVENGAKIEKTHLFSRTSADTTQMPGDFRYLVRYRVCETMLHVARYWLWFLWNSASI